MRPKVIFFDVNETLLDLAPVKNSVTNALGGNKDLVALWFTTLLQYSLVATVGNHYRDFNEIGMATLQMVAKNQGIALTNDKAREILKPMLSLSAYPEVPEALARLRQAGFRLFTLTNSSNKSVQSQITHAGLKEYFENLLSVEDVGKFKPDVKVYEWACQKAGIQPGEGMLIAAHGWDVAGGHWAGLQTAFISRPGQQLYPLTPKPQMVASDLTQISNQLVELKN